jgi:hypothetical protein
MVILRRYFPDVLMPGRTRQNSAGERVCDLLLEEIFHEATSVYKVVSFKKKSIKSYKEIISKSSEIFYQRILNWLRKGGNYLIFVSGRTYNESIKFHCCHRLTLLGSYYDRNV